MNRWLAAFFSHAMPHWRHRRATVFITALFALRIPTGHAAAPWAIINPESSGRHSAFTLQTRGTSDVVKDKYFIPAIASMGAVLLLSFVCCYCLGWCFNRKRMQKSYSRTAYPASTLEPRPIVKLNPPNGTGPEELKDENSRYHSNVGGSGVPPSSHGSSAPGSPQIYPTAQLQPTHTQYAASNWHYNHPNQYAYPPAPQESFSNTPPVQHYSPMLTPGSFSNTPYPTPGQHYSPMPPPTTMANVEYTNSSRSASGMYQNRGLQPEVQRSVVMPQAQPPYATPTRMSSMSSGSSTQIGEHPSYGYFPQPGDTLSYASSRPLSMTGDGPATNATPPVPEVYGSVPDLGQQLQRGLSNPPAYVDDGKMYPKDKKSRKKN